MQTRQIQTDGLSQQILEAGSGPLVDVGVYPLHALTGLLGPVELVTAISARTQQSFVQPPSSTSVGRTVPVEVDDVWHVLMRHVGGAISSVRSDFATHGSTAGADVDVHLVRVPAAGATATGCVIRDDRALVADLAAGSWWIAVDSFAGGGGPKPGAPGICVPEVCHASILRRQTVRGSGVVIPH